MLVTYYCALMLAICKYDECAFLLCVRDDDEKGAGREKMDDGFEVVFSWQQWSSDSAALL